MSETRDKAKQRILDLVDIGQKNEQFPWFVAEQILSIPELAIIDREAELPFDIEAETECVGQCNITCHNIERKLTMEGMLKAGYVKEVKK